LNDSKEYISISHDGLFYWIFKTDKKNNEKVFTETKDYNRKLGMEIREKVDAHFCELMKKIDTKNRKTTTSPRFKIHYK